MCKIYLLSEFVFNFSERVRLSFLSISVMTASRASDTLLPPFNALRSSEAYFASVKWAILGSGNSLSPIRCQPIAWVNDGKLSIEPRGAQANGI